MDKWLYRISVALAIIGLSVSTYMTIFKIVNDRRMCLGSGGCNDINNSPYSEINGIPVAVFGIVGYAAILAVHYLETKRGYFKDNAVMLIFGMALTGFLFTLWLVYVEVVLVKALCPFCVTSQIGMTIIFIISIVRLVRDFQQH